MFFLKNQKIMMDWFNLGDSQSGSRVLLPAVVLMTF
jgi:hypothetical protein